MTARSVTAMEPRVAAALGISKPWSLTLFTCRLMSIAPAIWWGFPIALRFLLQLGLHIAASSTEQAAEVGGSCSGKPRAHRPCGNVSAESAAMCSAADLSESRLRLTETSLAVIWCGASGYLSFFFTDCLMSKWLLNYTPQATVVRLLTINVVNGYLTSWVLYLTGGVQDARLVLPAWIAIATILTVLYHLTQRNINIRKETSMSISVFSIASFISMVALLAQLHLDRPDQPDMPLIPLAKKIWHWVVQAATKYSNYGSPGEL
ncbi:hypothetical protein VTK73DRAFT_2705 [Phialemonium thermophilum]|uniref:N-glycosylation protein EOS1 n=1 Tax=Phialemonium thermophilum TaxID=223376 RepID=A0ABR3VQW4_9PEZI